MAEAGSAVDAVSSSRLCAVLIVCLVFSIFIAGCGHGGSGGTGGDGINLAISMTHSGSFAAGTAAAFFIIAVSNSGNAATSAVTTVSDNLPNGLFLMYGTGPSWSCSATNPQNVTCTNMSSIVAGATSQLTLEVGVNAVPPGAVSNTATVATAGNTPKSSTDTVFLNSCTGSDSGNEGILQGQYVVLAQGFDAAGPAAALVGFTADGRGHITAGEGDLNNSAAPQHVTINAAGSSYTVGLGNDACLQLAYSGGATSAAMFRLTLGGISNGVASKGWAIGFDGNAVSGSLRLQDPAAFAIGQLQPNYAFGADGVDSSGRHTGISGFFSLTTKGIRYDLEEGGPLGAACNGTGLITSLSGADGRGLLTLTPGCAFSSSAHEAIYVVNADEFFFVQTDQFGGGLQFGGGSPIISGRAVATGSSFSSSLLNGNYILHMTGQAGGAAQVSLGLLTFTPGGATNGTVSGTLFSFGKPGGATTTAVTSATYNVDPSSGRVTFSGTGVASFVAYLAAPTDGVSAFLLGEPGDALGALELQPNQTYTNASVAGTYFLGTEDPGDNTIAEATGVLSDGATSGIYETVREPGSTQAAGFAKIGFAVSQINSDGTGVLNGGVLGNSVAITNGAKLFLINEGACGFGGCVPVAAVIYVAEK